MIINGVEIIEKKKIAKEFNKYFVNVGPKLTSLIPKSSKRIEDFLSGNYPTLNESPLTVKELKNTFSELKSNKSPGFDDVIPDVARFVINALIVPTKHIFDLSLKQGVFPDKHV